MKTTGKTFSSGMVRAMMAGKKTETRRLFHDGPKNASGFIRDDNGFIVPINKDGEPFEFHLGKRHDVGDRIYIREHWRTLFDALDDTPPRDLPHDTPVVYCADRPTYLNHGKFRQAMHMPKWAHRAHLIVKSYHIERLQEIDRAGAMAEGIVVGHNNEKSGFKFAGSDKVFSDPVHAYAHLWNDLHKKHSWDQNPWVSVTKYDFYPTPI